MIIVCDFETYYSKTYSLSKLTTEEYIRGDEYETIGVSVKVDDAPAQWFSGSPQETKNWLWQFEWGKAMVVAHNAMFDAAILNWRYDIRPYIIADTLSMARAIHGIEVGGSLAKLAERYEIGVKGNEVIHALDKHRADFTEQELAKYGEYCVNDTELTYKLFNILVEGYPKKELKLIDLTIRMFSEPVLELDEVLLQNHMVNIKARKEELLSKIAGDPETAKKNIMSNVKFAELLSEYGVDAPMKISPTTGKQAYAFAKTDEELKALLEHPDPNVQALVSARLGVKSTLEETRTQRFLEIAQRGSLPIPLKYYAAHTGRWGGADKINLQNLPSRGADAGQLKKAIKAPKGYVIIDADSAQIEARVLAWMAGVAPLVEAFRKGEDVYKLMAAAIYAKDPVDITPAKRFIGKAALLGCGYGMGYKKFHKTLLASGTSISEGAARTIVNTYRAVNSGVVELWAQGDRCLAAMLDKKSTDYGKEGVVLVGQWWWKGFVTPNKIPFRYYELRRVPGKNVGEMGFAYTSRTGAVSIWGGKLTENIIQHLARCIIGEQMLRIAKKYRVVLTVHDAIACIALEAEADEARAYVEECMRWTPAWADGLPLNCESGVGKTYGEC